MHLLDSFKFTVSSSHPSIDAFQMGVVDYVILLLEGKLRKSCILTVGSSLLSSGMCVDIT